MELIINKIIGDNFKGKSHIEVELHYPNTSITGENGSGKTTIKDMVSWVLADTDSTLTSNPNVRPEGADDGIVTRVELAMTIDDKPVSFAKTQKTKSKTDSNGKVKTTKTNSFEVNSVPKSQRDAFKYLEELAFNADRYPALSDPNVFLKDMSEKKVRNAIRSTLFGMTTAITDAQVAKKAKLKELEKMLKTYDKEEIVAMQNATKRKITAEYGKNGEVIDYKIDGLNSAKVDADTTALESEKAAIMKEIKDLERQIADLDNGKSQITELLERISEIEKSKRDHLSRVQSETIKNNRVISEKEYQIKNNIRDIQMEIENIKKDIVAAGFTIETMDKAVKEHQAIYKRIKAEKFTAPKFDKKSLVCPTCGRPFDEKEATEIRVKFEEKVTADKKLFEEDKAERLAGIVKQGKTYSAGRDKAKADKKTCEANLKDTEKRLMAQEKELGLLPEQSPVAMEDAVTKSFDAEIADLRKKVQDFDASAEKAELNAKMRDAHERYSAVDRQLAKVENNAVIDRQIAELQAKRKEYEQARLDADRILDEVKQLEMAKNELLTEQINSHFRLVNWVLFETQANGEVLTDRCIPTIDGKSLVDEANTGLVILAKLDIVQGLQEFYGERYPVWLDNAEALTSNTSERIELNSQLITMSAVDGQELKVE